MSKEKESRPITETTQVVVASAIIRGEEPERIAKDLGRNVWDVMKAIERSKKTGVYDRVWWYLHNKGGMALEGVPICAIRTDPRGIRVRIR